MKVRYCGTEISLNNIFEYQHLSYEFTIASIEIKLEIMNVLIFIDLSNRF